jgi:uncharacterized protein
LPFTNESLTTILKPWRTTFDLKDGGYNRAPKFPMPNNWRFLLREAYFSDDDLTRSAVEITLKKMAWGGIYDHAGGGFARYSVDGLWHVPHFEKMTYDNGQLLSLYSEAFQQTHNPLYKRVVEETFAFMEREMRSPEGAWYSSLDADSEGEEGKFYVWKKPEIAELLGSDAGWFCDYYQVTDKGNWEHGKSILMMHQSPAEFAQSHGLSEDSLLAKLEAAKQILLTARAERIRPGLDDKILASWNALMLKGCVDAFHAFGDTTYLDAALRNANFLVQHMRNGEGLFRNYKNGKASINGFLDDYALVAEALIALYQATFDPQWLKVAEALVEFTRQHFFNRDAQLFFYTSDLDPALIARKMELMDNVIPASNSVMANVLFDLGHLLERQDYLDLSVRMLQNIQKDMPRYGGGYSNWAMLMLKHIRPFFEVVVTGPNANEVAHALQQMFIPNKVVVAAVSEQDGQLLLLDHRFAKDKTFIYVCEGKVCQLPTENVDVATQLVQEIIDKKFNKFSDAN